MRVGGARSLLFEPPEPAEKRSCRGVVGARPGEGPFSEPVQPTDDD